LKKDWIEGGGTEESYIQMFGKDEEPEKIKVYELDFGDQNLTTETIDQLFEWIRTDLHELKGDDELNYTITTKMMTREEIDALPDWGN
jgi:hypothetical protein